MTEMMPLMFWTGYMLIPLAAGAFALFTLHRIRTALERIEQRMPR